jgi:hypothetical protein
VLDDLQSLEDATLGVGELGHRAEASWITQELT